MEPEKTSFIRAVPVWEAGTELEMNRNLYFTAVVPGRRHALLRIAAHTRFQLFANGRFVAAGPARAGHGWYRVDEYEIGALLQNDRNVVCILCAGYNCNSYAYLDEPSFLCCEITDGDELLAATGDGSFAARPCTQRVQKVQRYSFQRPFVESWRLDTEYDRVLLDPDFTAGSAEPVPTARKKFMEREVPYSAYDFVPVRESLDRGSVVASRPEKPFSDRAIDDISQRLKGFARPELEELTMAEAERWVPDHADRRVLPGCDADLAADSYMTFRLPKNLTGFLEMRVTAEQDVCLMVTFDEVYNHGEVDYKRMGCSNVLVWRLAAGRSYELRSFEPYTMQYLNVLALGGSIQLRGLGLRRFDFPAALLTKTVPMPTERLQVIYDAAVESFRQNTVDIYMDCPSRERAGWLCDSFFTSRVERALTGRSTVEHAFLENFLLPDHFDFLPEGMLPMCYPSDHNDGVFIPNWAMWFVLELEEYLQRTGDRKLVESARERVYALLAYFRRFENADGLLEKLESWVFVEWSRSNDLVQDISYPTNMLYARMKEAMAALYSDRALADEASALKSTIRSQAFMGDFFCDNAIRRGGKAELSGEATESCQYYAFFTGVATPETYPALWKTLLEDFGPERKKTGRHPEVAFSNAFVGNYLRLELLYRAGLTDRLVKNIDGYFTYMAQKTGTLWEHDGDMASCDHGFASHVLYWLNGIYGEKN